MKWVIAVLAAAAWLAADSDRPDQVAFKSGVELVRVDVLVTRDGVPLTGLTAADFEVTDNGVRQTVDHVLSSADPIDVVLALDSSGSLDQSELARLADGVRLTIDDLKPGDRAGLMTFADELTELVPLTDKCNEARSAVDRMHSSGATTLVDATYAALLAGRADDRRLLALIFTDGGQRSPNSASGMWLSTRPAASRRTAGTRWTCE